MLKFHLQLDWLHINYFQNPSKTHSINFSLQNEQGEQLTFERKIISNQRKTYQLDTLSPFQIHMIVDQNKHQYCPFRLQLISRLTPLIKRNLDLHLSDIFDHYLNHQLFADIQPLQQLFSLEDCQIIYRITILEVETVTDTEEFSHIKKQLTNADFLHSESKAGVSQLTTEEQMSKQGPSVQERSAEELKLYESDNNSFKVKTPHNPKKLKNLYSMASMNFEQLSKIVEGQAKKRKEQLENDKNIYQTNHWYLKLGQKHSHLDQNEAQGHSEQSLKIKILVILILLGLFLFIYCLQGNNKEDFGPPSKQRKGKKSNHARHENVNKKSQEKVNKKSSIKNK